MDFQTTEDEEGRPCEYTIEQYWAQMPEKEQQSFAARTMTEDPTKKHGYLGIEYVLHIEGADCTTSRYECTLCNVRTNKEHMEYHVKTSFHREEFLRRHFPQITKKYRKVQDPLKAKLLEEIAIIIEKYHGRNVPMDVEKELYASREKYVIAKCRTFLHANENSGLSTKEIIYQLQPKIKQIKKMKKEFYQKLINM